MKIRRSPKTEIKKGQHLSRKTEFKKGENRGIKNPKWKGEKVGYSGIHSWLYRYYGKASTCKKCKGINSTSYEWANKSGKYLRVIKDWVQLCKSCHAKYDNVGYKSWIKRRNK